MLYVNISKERQLVCSNRVKKWVEPRESVDIGAADMKFLGAASSALMPKNEYDLLVARKLRKRARRARRARKLARRAKAQSPVIKKKKSSIKSKITKAVKKVVKRTKKEPTSAELKAQRANLKKSLSEMNKKEIVSFGYEALELNLKAKDKKDVMINKILTSAKKVGYKKVIKKI